MTALGTVIRRRREARGWTVYRLAQRVGMSDPYLSTIESGRSKRVGIAIIARIAQGLGMTTDQLLAEAGFGQDEKTESLAERIVTRRESLGLTQRELADRAGVAQGWLWLVEKGRTTAMSPENRQKLAQALDVDAGWLEEAEAPPMTWDDLGHMRAMLRTNQLIESDELLDHLELYTRMLIRLDRAERGLPPLPEEDEDDAKG